MSAIRFSFPASVVAAKGRVDRHDLLILRKYSLVGGIKTYEEASLLLGLSDACPDYCDEWPDFVIESLSTFLVDVAPPQGRLDDVKSAWLIGTLGIEGVVKKRLQLELLLHIVERAGSCPALLSAFALEQLRLAFLPTPRGACSDGRADATGITAEDLVYVWRILRGAVENGRLRLSGLEASVLTSIEHLVRSRRNHPGWLEVMDHVAGTDRAAPALRMRPWIVDPQASEDAGSGFASVAAAGT